MAALDDDDAIGELLGVRQDVRREHHGVVFADLADQTLDLDLLLLDRQVIRSAALTVPHPAMAYRRFVLEPAAQIAGDWTHTASSSR
mgnify:CR=1 FL=1